MNIKSILLCVVVLVLSLFSIASAKDLTRAEAAKKLSKLNFGTNVGSFPKSLNKDFQMGTSGGNEPALVSQAEKDIEGWIGQQEAIYANLEEKGFIKYNVWKGTQGQRPPGWPRAQSSTVDYMYVFVQFNMQATEKLNPYIISSDHNYYKVILANIIFNKITGVTKISDSEARVEFTLKTKDTPLKGLVDEQGTPNLNRSVVFRKYDDGWRLVQ